MQMHILLATKNHCCTSALPKLARRCRRGCGIESDQMFWLARLFTIHFISLLSALLFLAIFLLIFEHKSLLRGNGSNFSYTAIYKLIYISIMLAPSSIYLDSTSLLGKFHICKVSFVLYAWSFLDGSESSGYGRASNFIMNNCTNWFFRMVRRRLNLKCVKVQDLDPKQQYLFAVHPHGILPFGGFSSLVARDSEAYLFSRLFGSELRVRLLAASFCFLIPVYRELLLWAGFIDAGRASCTRAIRAGFSLALCPGGASEALHVNGVDDILLLSERKGFIRMAIENGLSIVPIFSFNENGEYSCIQSHQSSWLNRPIVQLLRKRIQRIIGWSVPLVTHIFPARVNVTVVYGRPVSFPKVPNPSASLIYDAMNQYKQALTDLYNEFGPKFNEPANKKLVFM